MARTMYILLVNFPNGAHYELVNFTGGRERKRSNIPETVIAWRNIVEFADIVEVILHSLALAGHHIRPFECRRAVIDCRLQFNKLLVMGILRKHNVPIKKAKRVFTYRASLRLIFR